jgi:hypothetical protein
MTNADLSFDDLIRLGGPAPVGRETETGRVRRRRHARPDAAAEPRPVRTLHAVEGVIVAQEPAIENAAADDDTPLEDLLSMVGLDATELQIVETAADAPGTVLAAAPAAAAVPAPVSVMPMPVSAVQTPVSAAPAPPVVAEPMPTAVESPRRAAAAAAAAAVAAPVSAVTITSIVAEPAPASEAPVSPRRAAAAASAVPAPVAAMPAPVAAVPAPAIAPPAPVAAMPAPVAAAPSASVVAEPVPAAALIESPRRAAAAEAAPAKQLTAPKQPKADRADKRGEFYRAELSSNWQRFRENIAVRVSGWVVLVGATGGLVFAAVSRF